MGNTASEPYEGPPELLSERSLEGIAEWMGSDVCEENVFVMVRIVNLSYPSRPSGPTLSSHLPPFPPSEGSRQLTRSFAILSALATLVHLFPSVPIPTVRGRYQHLGGHPRFQVSENRQVLPWARGLSLCLESVHETIEPDVSSLPMAATAGLYANLARLNLPRPEAVFDIDYFRRNPQPFYTLAQEIAPGRFLPTPTHLFIRLLHEKRLLHTCFTQNIDTLERIAGVPSDKVIEAHGSFVTSSCISCKVKYDNKKMEAALAEARVVYCEEEDCGSLVKPDIVFFGESLPKEFGAAAPSVRTAGLVIVMGTSLQVQPFSMLPTLAQNCPRLLINLDPVGDFGTRSDDVLLLSECDVAVQKLCEQLGWTRDLERLIEETKAKGLGAGLGSGEVGGKKDDAELLAEHLAEETSKKLKLDEDDATPKNPEAKLPLDETPLAADPLVARQVPKAALPVNKGESTRTNTEVEREPVSSATPQTSTGDPVKSADTIDDTKSTS